MNSNFIIHKNFVVVDNDLNTDELWYVAKNIKKDEKLININKEYKKLSCESKLNFCKKNYGGDYNYNLQNSNLQNKN